MYTDIAPNIPAKKTLLIAFAIINKALYSAPAENTHRAVGLAGQ